MTWSDLLKLYFWFDRLSSPSISESIFLRIYPHLHSIAFRPGSFLPQGAQGSAGRWRESYLNSEQPPLQVVNQCLVLSGGKAGQSNQDNKSSHFVSVCSAPETLCECGAASRFPEVGWNVSLSCLGGAENIWWRWKDTVKETQTSPSYAHFSFTWSGGVLWRVSYSMHRNADSREAVWFGFNLSENWSQS